MADETFTTFVERERERLSKEQEAIFKLSQIRKEA
jgi:hypothetical protein